MSKRKSKKKTTLDIMKETRNQWAINPITRVHGSQKGYNRTKEKRKINNDLDYHRAINIA